MQTKLSARVLATPSGRRADEILRACVHCGFCNATCPTYQLTGNELDGPRGRIYLIKDVLERDEGSKIAQQHLDRCLTCRACETTCPSGVAYGELAEIGRARLEVEVPRGVVERAVRWWMLTVMPRRDLFALFVRLGNMFRGILPRVLARAVPHPGAARVWHTQPSTRRVLLLEGCAQAVVTPQVNAALAQILSRCGVEAIRTSAERCCGSLPLHLGAQDRARLTMTANVNAIYEAAQGCEAIISSASGCGVTIKEYDRLLAGDDALATRARWVAEHTRDAAEFVSTLALPTSTRSMRRRVAWHSPCTLQHGQHVTGVVERVLRSAGFDLVAVSDAHLCCGSAGTYSVLQSQMAERLLENKVAGLTIDAPDVIATANIGCALHIAHGTSVPVVHWIELINDQLEILKK